MEPMTLGSAPSSPVSPGVNPNFLPSFLMGETPQPITPAPSTSPGRMKNNSGSGGFKLGLNPMEPRNLRQKLFNQSMSESPVPVAHTPLISEKPGPPKMSLFDTIENKRKAKTSPLSSTAMHQIDSPIFNESLSRINEDTLNLSRTRYTLSESINRSHTINQFQPKIDTNWVTVFGFLPSTLNLVLAELSNCGPIIEKKMPAHGNWINVRFNNANEVAKALALNSKCINDSVMIGVSLYHNKKEGKENEHVSYSSPMRARPLRQSFVSPPASNSVLPPQNVPQKSTGIVTKAMEYVFGW